MSKDEFLETMGREATSRAIDLVRDGGRERAFHHDQFFETYLLCRLLIFCRDVEYRSTSFC